VFPDFPATTDIVNVFRGTASTAVAELQLNLHKQYNTVGISYPNYIYNYTIQQINLSSNTNVTITSSNIIDLSFSQSVFATLVSTSQDLIVQIVFDKTSVDTGATTGMYKLVVYQIA
jgi:hypothetical protein